MSFESSTSKHGKDSIRRCARKFRISWFTYRLVLFVALVFFSICANAQERNLPTSLQAGVFYVSAGALAVSGVLDYHSGLQAARHGAIESNPLGSKMGSFGSVALSGVLGYYLHRCAPGRWKWLGSVLAAGTASYHFWAARRNYALR